MMETDQHAFERPYTVLNRTLDVLAVYEPLHQIHLEKIKQWIESAKETFSKFFPRHIVEAAISEANWELIDGIPPKNVWAGEALFNGKPTIRIYSRSHLTRVPFPALFDALGLSLIHHILGHIVPRKYGLQDYGEETACLYQLLAAEQCNHFFLRTLVKPMIPVFSWLHKNIRHLLSFIGF